MKLSDFLKKHSDDPTTAIRQVKERLDSLRQQRTEVENAPMAREDVEAWLFHHLDAEAARYPELLRAQYSEVLKRPYDEPCCGEQTMFWWNSAQFAFPLPDTHQQGNKRSLAAGMQSFIAYLFLAGSPAFKDQIKQAITSALSEWDWSGAGLPRAERLKKLEELDKKIAAAEKEYNELREDLNRLSVELRENL